MLKTFLQKLSNKAAHAACGWTRTSYACARPWRQRYAARTSHYSLELSPRVRHGEAFYFSTASIASRTESDSGSVKLEKLSTTSPLRLIRYL